MQTRVERHPKDDSRSTPLWTRVRGAARARLREAQLFADLGGDLVGGTWIMIRHLEGDHGDRAGKRERAVESLRHRRNAAADVHSE